MDDALLMQAEPQLAKHPDAKAFFDDAKAKSKDRHKVVDQDLVNIDKALSKVDVNSTDFDEPADAAKKNVSGDLTMNDVTLQAVGQKPKSNVKQHS